MSIKPGKYKIHPSYDYAKIISVKPTTDYTKPVVVDSHFPVKASIWSVEEGPEPDLYLLSVGGNTAYDGGGKVVASYIRPIFWRIVQHGHPWGFKILRADGDEGWYLENTHPLEQVKVKEVSSGPGVGGFLFAFEWISD